MSEEPHQSWSNRALILVDLQKEFLSKEGRFPVSSTSRAFLGVLQAIIPAFRSSGGQIVWIRSEYANNPWTGRSEEDGQPSQVQAGTSASSGELQQGEAVDFLSGTHSGRKACCEKGAIGAQLADEAVALLDEEADLVLVKTWYSAFKETTLAQDLTSRGITELFFGGLITNVCVLATSLDAKRAGTFQKVHIIKDCLGWNNEKSHNKALLRMEEEGMIVKRGREVVPSAKQVVGSKPLRKKVKTVMGPGDKIGAGDSEIVLNILPEDAQADALERLKKEVAWQTMYHRGGEVPRLVAVEGEINGDGSYPIYRHPADESPTLRPFSPIVQLIRTRVEKFLQHPVNHVLIQHYRTGNDYISEHSDKTIDVVPGSKIVNVSIGAQRTMVLRQKKDAALAKAWAGSAASASAAAGEGSNGAAASPGPSTSTTTTESLDRDAQRVPLPHNSMFVMGLETNTRWLHGIRQDRRPATLKTPEEVAFSGERISLTFRRIGTFLSKDETMIYGQGATGKTREEAKPVINDSPEDSSKMIMAFGLENQQTDFDWQKAYGAGFDVLHFARPKKTPTLYYVNGSIPSWRVQMALFEKGIQVESVRLRVMTKPKETRLPEFLSINHRGKTPVFIDSDPEKTTVNESLAILTYLETFYPTTPLLPPPTQRRARARVLSRLQETENLHTIYDALEDAHFDGVNSTPKQHIPDIERAALVGAVYAELAFWEVYAGQSKFIAGEEFSLADCAFFPLLGYMFRRGFEWTDELGKLKAYFERVKGRECAVKAQPEGWEGRGKANIFRLRGIV